MWRSSEVVHNTLTVGGAKAVLGIQNMSGEDPQLVKQQRSLAARLQSDWANLLGDEETADMELLAGTERIPVHRLVLRARCGRLWDRLKEEKSVDGERTTLGFPHLSPKAVKIVVRYLYTAKVRAELSVLE